MSSTEFVLLGKPSDLKIETTGIEIKSDEIVPSQKAKNLRIIFDQTLSMTDQVLYVKSLYFEIRHIRKIRNYLPLHVTTQSINMVYTVFGPKISIYRG